MSIHEAMHAYVGLKLGDETAADQGRVSINPLRHIDPFMTVILPALTLAFFHFPILAARPVPFNPDRVRFDEYGAALIAAAGPLSNLALAIIGTIIARAANLGDGLETFLATFITVNVALFIFNIVPIPPLDGSRVLYAFAPEPLQNFMATIEPYGLFIVFGLVLFSGFGPVISGLNQSLLNLLGVPA